MKKHLALLVVALLSLSAPVAAQPQEFILGTPVLSLWDFTLAALAIGPVVRFEGQLDATPVVNTGLPPNATSYSYPWPQAALTVGTHTAQIRACSSRGCGPWDAKTFTVVAPLPPGVINHRLVPGSTPLSNQEGRRKADAFGELVIGRGLQGPELQYVIEHYQLEHPGEPLIQGLLMQTLLNAYAALIGRP